MLPILAVTAAAWGREHLLCRVGAQGALPPSWATAWALATWAEWDGEQASWASRLHRGGREGGGPALRVGLGQGASRLAGLLERGGKVRLGQQEEKRMERRREIRPKRIEKCLPFLIKHNGMKTKGVWKKI